MLTLYLQLLADGLVRGSEIGLVAISFAYVYSTTGIFHVAHAGIYTLAGYVAWSLSSVGTPFWLALGVAVLVSALLGASIQMGLYDRLERRGASSLVMLIASIGVLTALQNLAAMVFTPDVQQFSMDWRSDTVDVGDLSVTYPQVALFVASLAIFTGLLLFSKFSILGKRIRAVASNRNLAEVTRLRPDVVAVYVIAIASGIVAVPGVLTGVDQAVQPYNSLPVLLTAVVAMIAGGIGNLSGAFVMSLLLGAVQATSIVIVPSRWSIAVVFGLFILLIMIRPEGLFRQKYGRTV